MANLLHADAIQQLEVALLRSPAVEVVDLLLGGLSQSRPVTVTVTAPPHPCTYTSTPPAPPPASVPIVGVSKVRSIPAVPTIKSKSNEPESDEEILTTSPKTKASNVSAMISKCHHINTTLNQSICFYYAIDYFYFFSSCSCA